jgi:hypothetical protein
MGEVVRLRVIAKEHANQDSLPLRFGLHFEVDTDILIENASDLGVDERYSERHHYEGILRHPFDKKKTQRGHFVAGYRRIPNCWMLVTAWCNGDMEIEHFLSNTMRNLREDGILSPQMLLAMHPHYIKGEIASSASLISYLSRQLAADEIAKANSAQERALQETKKTMQELRRVRGIADQAIDAVVNLENEIYRIRAQLKYAIDRTKHGGWLSPKEIEEILDGSIFDSSFQENMPGHASSITPQSNALDQSLGLEQEPEEQLFKLFKVPRRSRVQYAGIPQARRITNIWRSVSEFRNVGVVSTIERVAQVGSKIELTYVDQNSRSATIEDFGHTGFAEAIFSYLKNREGRAAVFIVTQKPGDQVKLDTNTMLLPAYRDLWI